MKASWEQNRMVKRKLEYNLASAFLLYRLLLGTIFAYPHLSFSLIPLNARKRSNVRDLQILIPSHRKDSTHFTENKPQSSGFVEDFELNTKYSHLSMLSLNPISPYSRDTNSTDFIQVNLDQLTTRRSSTYAMWTFDNRKPIHSRSGDTESVPRRFFDVSLKETKISSKLTMVFLCPPPEKLSNPSLFPFKSYNIPLSPVLITCVLM